jgi:hypothetical protein
MEHRRFAMPKFFVGVILGALIFGIVAHVSRGQVATADVKAKEIRQGDIINMDVAVDRAPNLDGRLYVHVGPDGGDDQITLNCNLNKDATRCQAGDRMPLDAKLGKWTIRKIAFQALAPSPEKELAKSGATSFQVIPRNGVVVPSSATVSDIK